MTPTPIPSAIKTQLQVILRQDARADCVALVWPAPFDSSELVQEIRETPLRIVYCPSELAMREQLVLHKPSESRLIMLSPFDETRLGKDVLARLWKNEPKRISPWRTLEQLLQVRQIDPRLTRKDYRWIAECLVATYERYQPHISFGEVLDFDTAWQAVVLGQLDYREPSVDLDSLLQWSLGPGVSDAVQSLPKDVMAHLGDWLEPKLQEQSRIVQRLWETGHAGDMLSIGLVCSLIYSDELEQSQEILQARGRLSERFLGGTRVKNTTLKLFGAQTRDCVRRLLKDGKHSALNSALTHSEQVLASLDLKSLAVHSDLLPSGFGQRLDQFAIALIDAVSGKLMAPAMHALAGLRRHTLGSIRAQQVTVAEHAVRTCAWLRTQNSRDVGPSAMITDYVNNGGFVDWARSRIWPGDENERVSRAYELLTKKVSEKREQLNQQFSHHLPAIARGDTFGPSALPVEKALDELVMPIAKQQPVLLLVLDGMSQAIYRELAGDMVHHSWVELQDEDPQGPKCLLAALPSITRTSRYSLLAGALGEGVSADEKKAFAAHPGMKSLASTRFPPQLFHKSELQQTGSGALAGNVREIVAGREHRVVAAVINAVDDQLSSNAQVTVHWNFQSIELLRHLLEAARESGRIVILTSDHGHVLDHDMDYSQSANDAERFKAATDDPGPGEVLVEGARVIQAENKVILPWSEKIRFARKKMGYHGGGSLQEVIIPVGVYRNAGDTGSLEGWHEVPRDEPSWWALDAAGPVPVVVKPIAQSKALKTSKKDDRTIDFLDKAESTLSTTTSNDDWINSVFASPVFVQMQSRAGRVTIGEEQLDRLLRLLVERGGQQMVGALVQSLGIPAIRLNGFLAGAQKMLNVDGYAVLSIDRATKTVKLNIDLLKTQFEL